MQRRMWVVLAVIGMFLSLSACSASTQAALEETRKNGAHFATWRHMGYSLKRGTPETTTKRDIQAAQQQKWWGEVVLVAPIQ